MECHQARGHLLDLERDRLDAALRAELEAHLASCAACRRASDNDRVLTALLSRDLIRHVAPEPLRRRVAAIAPTPRRRPAVRMVAWASAGLAVGLAVSLWLRPPEPAQVPPPRDLAREVLDDHLRVLYAEHPLEIENGGVHQVRPWFQGRLDFAPVMGFGGDDDFRLEGGAVGYFVDRKAAMFLFSRRLHRITLFVFKDAGLAWPAGAGESLAPGVTARATTLDGFHLLLWRRDGLGYALASDLEAAGLKVLGERIASAGP